jgi:UDP-N-acetylmuramate--alanine ligase
VAWIPSILTVPLGSRFLVPPPNPLPALTGLRVHVLGIRGAGMAPAALAAQAAGAIVDGCDLVESEGDDVLGRSGIVVATRHDREHITDGRHLVVTTLGDAGLAEVLAARDAGRLHHRTEVLAALTRGREVVAVTGSHGKGTVAALVGCALADLGADPLVVLGVGAGVLGGPFRPGDGPAILEADDADGTIVRIPASISVVTNSWADHPMFGRSRSEVLEDVGRHVALVPPDGRVILGRGENLRRLAGVSGAPVWVLGRDFEVETVSVDLGRQRLRFHDPDRTSPVPGSIRVHGGNAADNALAAYAALRASGIEPEPAAGALDALDGLRRRCELVADVGGVRVFDDLGKHPAAMAATIRALRELSPRALHVVYEPFLDLDVFRWRRRWVEAFELADTAIVLPVDSRTSGPVPRRAPPDWPHRAGSSAELAPSRAAAAELVVRRCRPGDIVLVAGVHTDLRDFARSLVECLTA